MSDPLEDFLRAAPLNDRQRAGLWDMYEASKNADDLAARLKSMELPDDIKAGLWDLKSQAAAPTPEASVESAAPSAATWSDKLGLNQPTDSMLGGFLRGSGAAVVDAWQGAASGLTDIAQRKVEGDNAVRQQLGVQPKAIPEDRLQAPDTTAGAIGSYVPTVAEMAIPVGGAVKVGKGAINALPSAVRAGKKFEDVLGAAKNVPIDVADVGDAALRIQQLADRGGSMPMAVRKILLRMTDPKKSGMVYEESRDFASNISRLSKDEYGRMTPVVAREVAKLSASLNKANAAAAQAAGKGAEYKAAMREYARAMRIQDAISSTLSGAKKAVPWMGAAGAATWMTGKIANAIQGQ